MTSTHADLLGVLARADQRWANRHDDIPADTAYLECLARSVQAHLAGRAAHRRSVLADLVAAVLDQDYDPDGDLVDQAEEAARIVHTIRTYLLGVNVHKGVA